MRQRLAGLAVRRLHDDGVQLAEEDLVDDDPHLAEHRAVAAALVVAVGRVVRVVLEHVGQCVRQVRRRVRELGDAPARADELQHHPTDLVDADRLA